MSLESYGRSFSARAIWTRQQGVEPEPQYRTRSEDAMAATERLRWNGLQRRRSTRVIGHMGLVTSRFCG